MTIGVSLICRNEENYIRRAMHSCGFASHVALMDGESEDDTIPVAMDALSKVNPSCLKLVSSAPWENDFGAQRQKAYELLACVDGDDYVPPEWWMRIDSDEEYSYAFQIGVIDMLNSLPQEVLAVRVRQTNLYPDTSHYVANIGGWETWPRIFRMGYIYRWVGKVHEHVKMLTRDGLQDIPEDKIVTWNADVIHYGWLDKQRRIEREDLYRQIPGSGVTKRGDLLDRDYHIRLMPVLVERGTSQ